MQRFLAVAALLASCEQVVAAGNLKKIWEVNLQRPTGSGRGGRQPEIPVFAITFSPDGNKIAVVADLIDKEGERAGHRLYVIPVQEPPQRPDQLTVLGNSLNSRAEWSPDGTLINSNGIIVRASTGQVICNAPRMSRFIGNGLLIDGEQEGKGESIADFRHLPRDRPTRFTIYDSKCEPVKEWSLPGEHYVIDVSSDRQLALVDQPFAGSRLVDPIDGRVIQQWDGKSKPEGVFADNGKLICGGFASDSFGFGGRPASNEYPPKEVIRCRGTDNGDIVGESPSGHGGSPYSVATRSTRVVSSNFRYVRGIIRDRDRHTFLGAVVWEVRTHETLASWTPETQSYDWFLLKAPSPPKHIEEPFVFAISPDGEYIAEGGDGKIRLYKIEP